VVENHFQAHEINEETKEVLSKKKEDTAKNLEDLKVFNEASDPTFKPIDK